MCKIIDAHIHLDWYKENEQAEILRELTDVNVEAIVCVSNNLRSAEKVMELSKRDRRIKPAIGFHPEQALPSEMEIEKLVKTIDQHQNEIVAIGEVGLPYYQRQKNPNLPLERYVELLDRFIEQAARLDKPIVLHAVYDDAPIVCDLLERHNHNRAHFHWFKGDNQTIERMIANGYYISVTPDCVYEAEIEQVIQAYPITQMMVETDGPWPFEGPFHAQMTHPQMIHQSIAKIAQLKQLSIDESYKKLYDNTVSFFKH